MCSVLLLLFLVILCLFLECEEGVPTVLSCSEGYGHQRGIVLCAVIRTELAADLELCLHWPDGPFTGMVPSTMLSTSRSLPYHRVRRGGTGRGICAPCARQAPQRNVSNSFWYSSSSMLTPSSISSSNLRPELLLVADAGVLRLSPVHRLPEQLQHRSGKMPFTVWPHLHLTLCCTHSTTLKSMGGWQVYHLPALGHLESCGIERLVAYRADVGHRADLHRVRVVREKMRVPLVPLLAAGLPARGLTLAAGAGDGERVLRGGKAAVGARRLGAGRLAKVLLVAGKLPLQLGNAPFPPQPFHGYGLDDAVYVL